MMRPPLNDVESLDRSKGNYIYYSSFTLKMIDPQPPAEYKIFIDRQFLSTSNRALRSRHIWGTDQYTDDSDLVAVLVHLGYYNPIYEVSPHVRGLLVTVTMIAEPPSSYSSTTRNNLRSRAWQVDQEGGPVGAFQVRRVQPILGTMFDKELAQYHTVPERPPPDMVPAMEFSLTNDPWFCYSLELIGDGGADCTEWTLNRMLADSLYLETETDRYELCIDPATPVLPSVEAPASGASISASASASGDQAESLAAAAVEAVSGSANDHPCRTSCPRATPLPTEPAAPGSAHDQARLRWSRVKDPVRAYHAAMLAAVRPVGEEWTPYPAPVEQAPLPAESLEVRALPVLLSLGKGSPLSWGSGRHGSRLERGAVGRGPRRHPGTRYNARRLKFVANTAGSPPATPSSAEPMEVIQ
ncbi:putative Histone deacetylation protein Rxt3 [Paratrimastix pyriformis]|uniref:Histone deacetylation protein Rxt3 n=1 Tax=Paratrimastix pyriformis TaxID=342808 RepID=A0ABQ8USV2_9EUKA|nr:putative Histone deacetylation protein Rxt3 [Paratrimastix pyriformis]